MFADGAGDSWGRGARGGQGRCLAPSVPSGTPTLCPRGGSLAMGPINGDGRNQTVRVTQSPQCPPAPETSTAEALRDTPRPPAPACPSSSSSSSSGRFCSLHSFGCKGAKMATRSQNVPGARGPGGLPRGGWGDPTGHPTHGHPHGEPRGMPRGSAAPSGLLGPLPQPPISPHSPL